MASSTSSCSPPEGRRYKSRTTSARRNPIKRCPLVGRHNMSCTQIDRGRAIWNDNTTKTFLDLCIAEKKRLNYNNKGLTKIGWQNLYRNFKIQTGRAYYAKQLQNKFNGLKRMFNLWKKLKEGSKDPGAPPKFLDLLTELYADCKEEKGKLVSTGGNCDRTPSFGTKDSTPHMSHDTQIGFSGVGRTDKQSVREHVAKSRAKKRSSGLVASFKQLEQSIKSKLEEEALRVARESRDCLKVVKADGICEGDDLYNKAIYLFKNPINRAVFMNMKTLEGRLSFLRLSRMSSSEDSTTATALHDRRNCLQVMALMARIGALVATVAAEEASSSEEDP